MNPHTAAELPFRIMLLDQLFRHFGDVGRQRNHFQSAEFEVVQRPGPWRTILSAAVVGAIVGAALQQESRLRRYLIR
jgi:hypothetical protein